jgi:hypothetical protein
MRPAGRCRSTAQGACCCSIGNKLLGPLSSPLLSWPRCQRHRAHEHLRLQPWTDPRRQTRPLIPTLLRQHLPELLCLWLRCTWFQPEELGIGAVA